MRPLTNGLMFVFGGVAAVAVAFSGRQWVATWSATEGAVLEEVLLRLEPLSIPHRRKLLLMPTRAAGVTAVFEDSMGGSTLSLLAQAGNLGFVLWV